MVARVSSVRDRCVSVKYLSGDRYRYSVVVSRKRGNAVKRNRVKRLLREAMRTRQIDVPCGMYLIFMNKRCEEVPRQDLLTDLDRVLARIRNGLHAHHAT